MSVMTVDLPTELSPVSIVTKPSGMNGHRSHSIFYSGNLLSGSNSISFSLVIFATPDVAASKKPRSSSAAYVICDNSRSASKIVKQALLQSPL